MLLQPKFDEETRKVQFTGGSTFIISLPKRWITENQIERGSFIKLRTEEGGQLTIIPSVSKVQEKLDEAAIKVSPNDRTEMITRKIVSSYLSGYNSIIIKADKQQFSLKQRHEMKNFVRHMLVGTEIVTDTSAHLVLQVLLNYPELTIQNTLRRMSIIASSMHKDAILSLRASDNSLVKDVISTDNEVDRFNLYGTRLLRAAVRNPRVTKEIGLDSGNDCLGYSQVIRSIERTADHSVDIAENSLTLKHDLNDDTIEKIEGMSTKAIKMFETSMESLFRKDYNAAEQIIENIDEITNFEKEAVKASQTNLEYGANLRLIIESVRRTAEYACDIAEIVLNLSVDSILV